MRSILDGKIKLVLADVVLLPMMQVSKELVKLSIPQTSIVFTGILK